MEPKDLKKRRLRLGLRQDDLAELFGVSGNTISRWELGTAAPDAPGMLDMALSYLEIEHGVQADESMKAVKTAMKRFRRKLDQAKVEIQRVRKTG